MHGGPRVAIPGPVVLVFPAMNMIAAPSKMTDEDWAQTPFALPRTRYGLVPVGDGHELFAQEFGNPDGEPMMVLHGGPGGGCDLRYARYFDPARYRIVMFDQRGCGNSRPTTHADLAGAMKGNDTATLVEDIVRVREHFGIGGKMHVEGGSWGSTLALAYAIRHPEHVQSLVLRGVFLGDAAGAAYLFQGNAAHYEPWPEPLTAATPRAEVARFLAHFGAQRFADIEGAYRAYLGDGTLPGQIPPALREGGAHMAEGYARAWDEFVRVIPREERGNIIAGYVRVLEATPTDPAARAHQQRCAYAFACWEGLISQFSQEVGDDGVIDLGKFREEGFALDFARLEARYTLDGFYLSADGRPSPGGSDYLVDHIDRVAAFRVPIFVAHGANDQVCPVRDAYKLKERYEAALAARFGAGAGPAVYLDIRDRTGHSMLERGNTLALIEITRRHVPAMTREEIAGLPESAPAAR